MLIKDITFTKVNTKLAVILIILVVALVYANSLKNSFVWDDSIVVADNDFVKSWNNFHRLFNKSYLTKPSDIDYLGERDIGSGEFLYRPVSTLSYFIDFSIWKLNPFGFHLTNLFLHIINVILLFFLIILITRSQAIALLASLLFAIHPVNAETVNMIAFRPNLLSFLFFVTSFILFIKCNQHADKKKMYVYILSLGSFLLALFSKEMAIIFPVVLLCYDYFIKKMPNNIFAHLKKYYLGYASVLVFYLLVKFIVIGNVVKQTVAYPMGNFYTNIFTMAKVFATYIQWFLLPINVHPTLPDDPNLISYSLFEPKVMISIVLIVFILVIAIKIRNKFPLVSFATFWFFVALIPVANILYSLTNYMSARYLYLASVGFCLVASFLLVKFPSLKIFKISSVILQKISMNTAIIILIFYSIFTAIRNIGFKNNTVFWMEMTENYPFNALVHSSLGSCFRKNGLLDKAISEYKIALSLDSNYAKDYNNLGVCYYGKGMFDEAVEEFKRALKLNPVLMSAYTNLGGVFGDKGLYQEAIRCFEKAIQLDEKFLNAYNGLGVTYARMKKYDQAKKTWEKALQIDPHNKGARENLQKLRQLGI